MSEQVFDEAAMKLAMRANYKTAFIAAASIVRTMAGHSEITNLPTRAALLIVADAISSTSERLLGKETTQ